MDNLFFLDTDGRRKNDTTAATGSEDERGVGAWAARTVVELLKGSVALYPMRVGTSTTGAVFVLELPMNRMGTVARKANSSKANSSLGTGPSVGDFRQGLTPSPPDILSGGDGSYPSSHQDVQKSKDQSLLRYAPTNDNADDLVLAVMSTVPPQQPQPRAVMAPIAEVTHHYNITDNHT